MFHHIDANKIILNEQKGNVSITYWTIDQLIIKKIVMDNIKLKQRNIPTTWIDCKKAFDSVSHDRIIKTLKLHKFGTITTKFLRKTMNNWKTSLYFKHQDDQIKSNHFSINTGILQGDNSSGLLFIISLLPLFWVLSTSNIGYRINRQVSSFRISCSPFNMVKLFKWKTSNLIMVKN